MAQSNSLEIIHSKTGHPIPVVDGVFLHSEYDPVKEAKKFATSLIPHIKRNNRLVVFGLGLGYHIDEIINIMTLHHGANISLAVIEPNRNLVIEYLRHRHVNKGIVKIYCKETVEELFTSKELTAFMADSPGIIRHTPSCNLTPSFYEEVLDFISPQDLKSTRTSIKNFLIRREIARYPQTESLSSIHNKNIHAKEKWMEHLMKGFSSLAYENGGENYHE